MKAIRLLITAVLAVPALACDGGDAAVPEQGLEDRSGVTDETVTEDGLTDEEPVTEEFDYPEGPYGTDLDDVVADLKFWSPADGRWVFLHEFYGRSEVRLIMLSSGAGWCNPCRIESIEFNDYYAEHHLYGLEIIYTLYQDTLGAVVQADDPVSNAFWDAWMSELRPQFPVYLDPDPAVMSQFYETNSIPFAMAITTEDMKIVYKGHGFSPAFITHAMYLYLY